jgi:uncharacterized glyoxalase superfamily protein PhnB
MCSRCAVRPKCSSSAKVRNVSISCRSTTVTSPDRPAQWIVAECALTRQARVGEHLRILADAAAAGATITRTGGDKDFGYSGVFSDPDGHTWEVAYIAALALLDDGTVALGSA